MLYAENLHMFPLYHCLQKTAQGFFILFDKPGFRECVEIRSFYLANYSKQDETSFKDPFEHIRK